MIAATQQIAWRYVCLGEGTGETIYYYNGSYHVHMCGDHIPKKKIEETEYYYEKEIEETGDGESSPSLQFSSKRNRVYPNSQTHGFQHRKRNEIFMAGRRKRQGYRRFRESRFLSKGRNQETKKG